MVTLKSFSNVCVRSLHRFNMSLSTMPCQSSLLHVTSGTYT